jgi:hypothetical protein
MAPATTSAPSGLPLCRRAGLIEPATGALAGIAGVPQRLAGDGLPGESSPGIASASACPPRSRIRGATVLDVAQAKWVTP